MSISEVDLDLPPWAHRCGYPLANGKACRRLVADLVGDLCFPHAAQAGYVAGHYCAHVRAGGQQCKRLVRREGDRCWQHDRRKRDGQDK